MGSTKQRKCTTVLELWGNPIWHVVHPRITMACLYGYIIGAIGLELRNLGFAQEGEVFYLDPYLDDGA